MSIKLKNTEPNPSCSFPFYFSYLHDFFFFKCYFWQALNHTLLCGPAGKGLFRLQHGKHYLFLTVLVTPSKFNLVLISLLHFSVHLLKIQFMPNQRGLLEVKCKIIPLIRLSVRWVFLFFWFIQGFCYSIVSASEFSTACTAPKSCAFLFSTMPQKDCVQLFAVTLSVQF